MALPTTDEFLNNLYRMKRECAALIAGAEGRNDLKEARALQKQLAGISDMIRQKGGNLDA